MQSTVSRARPNYIYAIVGVSIVLLIIGILTLFYLQGQVFTNKVYEQLGFIVELEDGLSMEQVDSIGGAIRSCTGVIGESVEFVTKEVSFEKLKSDFGDSFASFDVPNPLYNIFTFHVAAPYMDPGSLDRLEKEISAIPGTTNAYFQTDVGETIIKRITQFMSFLGALLVVFFILSIVLIHNTVKLSMYANRFLIKNMELVGAPWSFVRAPFLRRSVFHGLLCGILASLGILTLYSLTSAQLGLEGIQAFGMSYWYVFAGLLLTGILIYVLSTLVAVNRYLRISWESLY